MIIPKKLPAPWREAGRGTPIGLFNLKMAVASGGGWSKRRRAASELGAWSWWPEGAERPSDHPFIASHLRRPSSGLSCIVTSHTVNRPTLHSLLAIRVVDSPQIKQTQGALTSHHCNHISPPVKRRRITYIAQQQLHIQRACCDHQCTESCSEGGSPTRPRSSPPPAGSAGSAQRREAPTPAPSTHMYAHTTLAQHRPR